MKGGKRPLGYTIVEVMIVLAVSGVMFVIAANFISGKQQRTAFTAGSNEFATQVQTVATQVIDGQFSDVAFGCSAVAGSPQLSITAVGERGQNPQCVFLGKFIHLVVGAGNKNTYEVFSIAGARTATSLAAAKATPIVDGNDLTLQKRVPQSLEIEKVQITKGGSTFDSYGVGFIQNLTADGGFASGGNSVSLVYSPGLNSSVKSKPDATAAITNNLVEADAATICVTDGTRYAKILLGNTSPSAAKLSVKLKVTPSCS